MIITNSENTSGLGTGAAALAPVLNPPALAPVPKAAGPVPKLEGVVLEGGTLSCMVERWCCAVFAFATKRVVREHSP